MESEPIDWRERAEKSEAYRDTLRALLREAGEAITQAHEQTVACWINHYGDNPEGSSLPTHIEAMETVADRIKKEIGG